MLHQQNFLIKQRVDVLAFVIFAFQLCAILIFSTHFLSIWIIVVGFSLMLSAFSRFAIYLREKKFEDNFCHFLDLVILEMRAGTSFRSALQRVNQSHDAFTQQKVAKILEILRFSKTPTDKTASPFLSDVIEEFVNIDQNSHNSLSRLNQLRGRLKTVSDFRRKSGQALAQIRAQGLVMLALYFATFAFLKVFVPEFEHGLELLLSVLLLLIGTSTLFLYGRRYKWKV